MTAQANAAVHLAAVASVALRPALNAPETPATLLGVTDHAAWVSTSDEVIVVADQVAVRLPNSVELAIDEVGRWVHLDDPVSCGDGIVRLGNLTAIARRWFNPEPVLRRTSEQELGWRLAEFQSLVEPAPDQGLRDALAMRNPQMVVEAAAALIGRGEGLTPEGDDVLAAAMASFLLLGRSLEHETDLISSVTSDLDALAEARTTSFSASLIKHGCRGRVARPVARVLRALVGRGSIEDETHQLLRVGHSSGAALATGLLIGASGLTTGSAQ